LIAQRGENPLLQDDSAGGLYVAKRQTHAQGWFDVDHRASGLEVLTFIENLHEDRREFGERSGSLEVTTVQADFFGANGDSGAGRALWSDLGGSVEQKSKTAAVLVHGSRLDHRDWYCRPLDETSVTNCKTGSSSVRPRVRRFYAQIGHVR